MTALIKRYLIDTSLIGTVGLAVWVNGGSGMLAAAVMLAVGLYSCWSFADGVDTGAKSATRVFPMYEDEANK